MSSNDQTQTQPTNRLNKHDPTWIDPSEVIHTNHKSDTLPMWAKENNTDYDFPAWFWQKDTTDKERSRWLTQERCRRQAKQQANNGCFRIFEKLLERPNRKVKANSATVMTSKYR